MAIVSMFTCLSPRVFAPDKGHVETIKYLIAKGMDPNCVDKKGKTAQLGCFGVRAKGSMFSHLVLACRLVVVGASEAKTQSMRRITGNTVFKALQGLGKLDCRTPSLSFRVLRLD